MIRQVRVVADGGLVGSSGETGAQSLNERFVMPIRKRHAAFASVITAVTLAGTGVALADGHNAKSEDWGLINRNVIGSPVGELRDGPSVISPTTGQVSTPPFGKGSLEIEVAGSQEKVAFGNEVDFVGDPVSGLSQAGFYVLRTGEDVDSGGPNNLPNIAIEINPHVAGHTYTTMVWDPDGTNVPVNEWSPYIDATTNGNWYFTGSTGVVTGCNQTTPCSLQAAESSLVTHNDTMGPATILSVAIAKGRDSQFQGAVDGLRINDQVYDFEKDGVHAHHAS